MKDEWIIAAGNVDPLKMEPGTTLYGIAQRGDTHCTVFTELKSYAAHVVNALNEYEEKPQEQII